MDNITAWVVRDVVTVELNQPIFEACVLMNRNNIGSVLVVDNLKPVGIFTERDLMNKVVVTGKDILKTPVSEVMTTDIKTASTSSSYKEVYDLMRTNNIRHLPIVENGVLVGIVSIKDLLRFNMRSMEKTIVDLRKEVDFVKSILDKTNDERNRELLKENDRLQSLVMVDSLTGLYNFRYFEEMFAKEMARAKRYNRPVTLLFIDVDHFKHYNDTNGHEAGNIVLRQLATIFKTTSRLGDALFKVSMIDIVARYGGEEFVIVLPETNIVGGFARAKKILEDVRNYPFYNRDAQPKGRLTVSVGVSEYPTDAMDWQDLIKKADTALYKAKNSGRDRVCSS